MTRREACQRGLKPTRQIRVLGDTNARLVAKFAIINSARVRHPRGRCPSAIFRHRFRVGFSSAKGDDISSSSKERNRSTQDSRRFFALTFREISLRIPRSEKRHFRGGEMPLLEITGANVPRRSDADVSIDRNEYAAPTATDSLRGSEKASVTRLLTGGILRNSERRVDPVYSRVFLSLSLPA